MRYFANFTNKHACKNAMNKLAKNTFSSKQNYSLSVSYHFGALFGVQSTTGLHACRSRERGIVNPCPRPHRSRGLPAVWSNGGLSVRYPVKHVSLFHSDTFDRAVFGEHHWSRRQFWNWCLLRSDSDIHWTSQLLQGNIF